MLANFYQNVASDYVGKALTSKSGTLAYLSPEVYAGSGYGPGADWWSLGVLFYECIYNKVCTIMILLSIRLTGSFAAAIRGKHAKCFVYGNQESQSQLPRYSTTSYNAMSPLN